MADLELKIETAGEVLLHRRLSRFGEGIKDFRPAFVRIVDFLRTTSKTHFATEGRGKWPPLSPRYAEWKRIHYPGKPIMQRTGALYSSLTTGSQGIEEYDPHQLRWGTRVPYAGIHQKGGPVVPQRRVVDLVPQDKTAIMKILQQYVVSLRDDV